MTTLDHYQQSFVDAVAKDSDILCEAVAGSGKSTTIEVATRAIDSHSIGVLAFNKAIATAMSERLPPNAAALTFNAAGHRALAKAAGRKITLDKNKAYSIVREAFPQLEPAYIRPAARMLSIARAAGLRPENSAHSGLIQAVGGFADDHTLENVVERMPRMMARGIELYQQEAIIDFDDQLYLPVVLNMGIQRYLHLFIDESQDVSPIQIELIAKMMATNSRLYAVGDSHQAIYGFRGADRQAIASLTHRFNLQTYPLSITYRCAQSIVQVAQAYVPHIEARPNAPLGLVETYAEFPTLTSDDLIICRNNFPLFKLAQRLFARRIPFRMQGAEYVEQLRFRINRICKDAKAKVPCSIKTFLPLLREWQDEETAALQARGWLSSIDQLEELCDIIRTLSEDVSDTQGIIDAAEAFFAGRTGPLLSSIHRAKGLEAERVFFLDSWRIPSKYARTPDELQQENNLYYVAVTRARNTLIFINGEAINGI